MTPPTRLRAQRIEALERANAVRLARARMKVALREGRADVARLVADPPAHFETMKVVELLLAVPRIGPWRVSKMMRGLSISQSKTLGGLSDRQRDGLAALLRPFRR